MKRVWVRKGHRNSGAITGSRLFNAKTVFTESQWVLRGSRITKFFMFIACCYYTIIFLMDYFRYPTVMTLHRGDANEAEFPTITLCNANWIRRSYFCQRASEDDPKSFKFKMMESSTKQTRKVCARPPNYKFESSKFGGFNCGNRKVQTLARFLGIYDFETLLNPEEKVKASQEISQFFQHCMFDSQSCDYNNFTRVSSPVFGRNCFRTHFDVNSTSYGFVSGLYVLFNLDAKEYFTSSLELSSMGINAHVSHNQNITVKLNSDVIKVAPERSTIVSMIQIVEKRLAPPYIDRCQDYKGGTRIGCKDKCWNKLATDKCGCKDPLLNFENDIDVCDLSNHSQKCCLYDLREIILSKRIKCSCNHACTNVFYSLTQSSEVMHPTAFNDSGIGLVHFFLRNSDITKYESDSKYMASDICSTLGGQFGLFLGLSLSDIIDGFFNQILRIFHRKNAGSVKPRLLNRNTRRRYSRPNSLQYFRSRTV